MFKAHQCLWLTAVHMMLTDTLHSSKNTELSMYACMYACISCAAWTWLQCEYLGIGWEVGTTGTNLGQLAICSCTLEQEAMWDLIFTRATCKHAHSWVTTVHVCKESQWHCMEGAFTLLCTSIHLTLILRLSSIFIVSFQPSSVVTRLFPFSVSHFNLHKWPKTNTINKKENIYIHSMNCATNNICNNTVGSFIYLLVTTPAGCFIWSQLLLHTGGPLHLLGIEGHATEGAERWRHLETGLQTLPTKPGKANSEQQRQHLYSDQQSAAGSTTVTLV